MSPNSEQQDLSQITSELPGDRNSDIAQLSMSGLEKSTSPQVSVSIMTPPLPQPASTLATKTYARAVDMDEIPEDLYPPENFAMVCPYIYRSGMPKRRNYAFLKKLKLKSILTLIMEEYPQQNQKFLEQSGIRLFQFGVAGNKEPFADIPKDIMCEALLTLMDRRNHPILIHCNKGKHRTGCLVGCLRKLQEWSNTSIFDEYRRYSAPKSRSMDQQFIELFDIRPVLAQVDYANVPDWSTLSLIPLPVRQHVSDREAHGEGETSTKQYRLD